MKKPYDAAYILPGYDESPRQKVYRRIEQIFRSKNFRPTTVGIAWRHKSKGLSYWAEQFLCKHNPQSGEGVILGFSLGAMVSLIVSAKIKPKALILCSLSPYFEEDLPSLPIDWLEWWKILSKSSFSFNKLAEGIRNVKVYLLVGEKEPEPCHVRALIAHKKIKASKLIVIKGVGHNIREPAYLEAIERVIADLTKKRR